MRTLRAVVLAPLLMAMLIAVIVPLYYLYTAATLPNPIDGAMQIEVLLRQAIESERQSTQYHKRIQDRDKVTWPSPDFSTLPKLLVALYIVETGCPTYFQTPRETGAAWKKRVLYSLMGRELEGDGACEFILARQLARRLGAVTPLQVAVASDRIHTFLQKDELVAFNLHSMQFDRGLIGVEAAARELMQKELLNLDLAELAELQLGISPHDYWEDIRLCKNGPLIRQSRDTLIDHLMTTGFINAQTAKNASEPAPRCLSIVRGPGLEVHDD